jgi:GAF domain-containing protein
VALVPGESEAVRTETLYAVIGAVAAGPDLDRVLPAVVDLLVDATACHACFLYLREDNLLRIRAASPIFAHVVDRVALHIDEGITGWVARTRQPALVREAALQDPRMKYVPELEEEHFQSLAAVPLVDRRGDVIGVVMLHTQAPREFGQDVVDLLVHVASLVVGAIDNARLYEQTQQQVAALSVLSDLSRELASLTTRDQLYEAGCRGIARLLDAETCTLSLYDEHGAAVDVARYPEAATDARADALLHAPSGGRLSSHLLDAGRAFGALHVAREDPFTHDHEGLLETAVNQLALALRTAQLIEHLAAESVVRRVFEALEQGRLELAGARGRAAGWNADDPHVAVIAEPIDGGDGWDALLGERAERRLRLVAPTALIDSGLQGLRALIPLPRSAIREASPESQLRDQLDAIGADLGIRFGISRARSGLADGASVLGEADDALRLSTALGKLGGALAYDNLGPYRFLVPLIESRPPDRRHARALELLSEYDARRKTALLDTLEAYLTSRGRVGTTAESLVVHSNTLRQRLERIETLTGLRLEDEDLLSLELSVKVHRLHRAR